MAEFGLFIGWGSPYAGKEAAAATKGRGAMPLTDGVVLVDRFTAADVDSLLAGEDGAYVCRSGLPCPFTRRDIADRIRHWQAQWQLGASGRSFAVRERVTRRLVGGCAIERRPGGDEIAEMSYWVFPPYRRRGYATRSVELVCRYAFDRLGIARVELCIEPTNEASLRVASNAGFRREGIRHRDDGCDRGRLHMVSFARLRTDSLPSHQRAPGSAEPKRALTAARSWRLAREATGSRSARQRRRDAGAATSHLPRRPRQQVT